MNKWFRIAFEAVLWVSKVRNIEPPEQARKKARVISKEFIEKFLPKIWINFDLKFWKESLQRYPEIIKAIQNYIKTWELSEDLPLLWLWNHQAFGLEAIWAYYYFPTNWRIVLKDDLLKPPFFWKWIKAIDPIIFHRDKWKSSILRNAEIKRTLFQNNAVLVYPEWTRSKDGEIRWFDYKKYKSWFEVITRLKSSFSSKVAIITSDTFKVLPQTLEKNLLGFGKVNSWKIIYTIDIIDASLYENIQEFNKEVKNILLKNLQKEKS